MGWEGNVYYYSIVLTEDDCRTLRFIGDRYEWSAWAGRELSEGENKLREHQAWAFRDAVEADSEDWTLPMLDQRCELHSKIMALLDSIV